MLVLIGLWAKKEERFSSFLTQRQEKLTEGLIHRKLTFDIV